MPNHMNDVFYKEGDDDEHESHGGNRPRWRLLQRATSSGHRLICCCFDQLCVIKVM